jgi:PGF-pre-PGF domain-containing protein
MASRGLAVALTALVVAAVLTGPVIAGTLAATGANAVGQDAPVRASDAATANETSPSLTTLLSNDPVESGDYYETGTEPEVTLNVSVGNASAENVTLDTLTVRINGESSRTFDVNGTTAERRFRPDIVTGNNSFRVIVTDSAGNITASSFTVYLDDHRPDVFLTSPYTTTPFQPIANGTVSGTRHTLTGKLLDDSDINEVTVERDFEGQSDSRTIRSPDENFSMELFLGYGRNDITLTATDEYGNTNIDTFSINVTDDAEPELILEPVPNQTAREQVTIAGEVTDDVFVSTVEITRDRPDSNRTQTDTVRNADDYIFGRAKQNVSFSTQFNLIEHGTYTVTVSATDIDGNTVTETRTIEHIPTEKQSVEPTIKVDEDRTVVLDSTSLFVSGSVFDGATERVVVETRNTTTNATIGFRTVYFGDPNRRITLDQRVDIPAGHTQVIVRATDVNGGEHTESFYVDGETKETFVGPDPDDGDDEPAGPSVTVTPLEGATSGTASSSATVDRVLSATEIAIPAADGNASAVATTANVTLDRVVVSTTQATNFTLFVTLREPTAVALAHPENTTAVATTTVQHSVDDAAIDDVTLAFAVRKSHLDAHNASAGDLTLYRQADEGWTALETTVTGSNDSHVFLRAVSPGLSVFSLATPDEPPEQDPGTPSLSVTNVSANATQVSTGDPVAISVTVANDGDAGGTYTTSLEVGGSVERERKVTVGAGNETTVRFTYWFDDAGNYTAAVDGVTSSEITVTANTTAGTPSLSVRNVTANVTQATPGDPVDVNVTAANNGTASGTTPLKLVINGTRQSEQNVTVAPGEETTVQFTHRFNETGNYTATVNGVDSSQIRIRAPQSNESQQQSGGEQSNGSQQSNESQQSSENGGGEPALSVTNVTANTTQAATGEPVGINATIANEGDAEGTFTASLVINGSVEGQRQVAVPPGESRTARFTHRFNETGNYTATVNGVNSEPIVVGGGLLSVFAGLPLGLVGMVIGGLVGLLVVVVLVRAVLRRVGGESAGG